MKAQWKKKTIRREFMQMTTNANYLYSWNFQDAPCGGSEQFHQGQSWDGGCFFDTPFLIVLYFHSMFFILPIAL